MERIFLIPKTIWLVLIHIKINTPLAITTVFIVLYHDRHVRLSVLIQILNIHPDQPCCLMPKNVVVTQSPIVAFRLRPVHLPLLRILKKFFFIVFRKVCRFLICDVCFRASYDLL